MKNKKFFKKIKTLDREKKVIKMITESVVEN